MFTAFWAVSGVREVFHRRTQAAHSFTVQKLSQLLPYRADCGTIRMVHFMTI